MVAVVLAGEDIAQVHLHLGSRHRQQRVAQRHRRVAVAPEVDDEAVGREPLALDDVDQLALGIALKVVDAHAGMRLAQLREALVERRAAVDFRLATARQVEVRPVDDGYPFHCWFFILFYPRRVRAGIMVYLKLGGLGGAGEGDDVADVGHAGDEEQEALEAEAEAGVGAGAEAACVEVPLHARAVHAELVHAGGELVVALLAHRAADDFANLGEEHVGALHGAAVVVLLHVEGLDVLGIVDHDDGALEVLLDEVALVLGGEVDAPADGELELVAFGDGLFEDADALGVGQADELGVDDGAEALDEARVDHLVEELEVVHAVVEGPADAVFDELLFEGGEAFEVVEGHLGLDHPELGQVAGRVAVFGAEGGAEGVDFAQRGGAELALELSADGQGGHLAEEVLAVVDRPVGEAGWVGEVEGGDLEHLAGALAVGGGDQRRVEVEEAALVEEGVDGVGHVVAHAHDGSEGVGAGAQVADFTEKLHGVALFLKGVGVGVGFAVDDDAFGLHLDGLARALALDECALDADTGTGGDALQLFLELGGVGHHLDVVDDGAVVEGDEGHILVAALGAHPAFDAELRADERADILLEEVFDFVTFHIAYFICYLSVL